MVQEPLLTAIGTPLSGTECGHTGAVTAVVVTDRHQAMSAGLDRALCILMVTKPRESIRKIERAHLQGIISVSHDAVNNWFVTGGFDGTVKVWSADAKPVGVFTGGTDDISHITYVPLTHCYWLVDRVGDVEVYDARAPAVVTDLVEESNDIVGHGISQLFLQPCTDCVFAATQDKGFIQYRCVVARVAVPRFFSSLACFTVACTSCVPGPPCEQTHANEGTITTRRIAHSTVPLAGWKRCW